MPLRFTFDVDRDDAMLKNWRDDSKVLQAKKYHQRLEPGKGNEIYTKIYNFHFLCSCNGW